MSTLELVRLALSRLGSSRLRATLTMLGVIIGVASVVALVAVGQGATSGITKQLQGLGTNLLTVNPGSTTQGFTRSAAGSAETLTVDDAAAIAKLDDVAAVEPEISTQGLVVAGSKNTTTTILGTTPQYLTVRNYSIWQGSFLNQAAVDSSLRQAVLGSTTADNLALGADAIGTTVTINGLPFQIVGILQAKGSSGPFSNDDQVIVPITAVQHYYDNTTTVRSIGISVTTADKIASVKASITNLLEQRHAIAAGGTDDFTIQDQAQLLGTVDSISSLLTILLGGIASISLLVGGIGIMNIMLVSVRERTREIGVRKAVGARGRDILAQFLVEALTLSVLGGIVGVVLGVAVSALIGQIAGWGFAFNPVTIAAAVLFSLAVGVVFGVWPARQAARLDPISALRYE
jgi:putative ABC transport system permease protein